MVDTLEGECCVEDALRWKLGRVAECKLVLKKQEDNCPHKWQRG
jgi:hypothetical protein